MRAIVIVLRGCPAGWLGTYGNEWVVTPNLDQFAAEGVLFDQHVSDCPDPIAAGEAWFHGSRLLEELHAAEVRTVFARANHPDTDAPPSYYAAWKEVFDARPQADDDSPLDNLIRSLPSLLDKLASIPRWLVWVEVDRLLPPWDVSQEVFEAYLEDEVEDAENEEEDEEPIEPYADPPTGPFDISDSLALQWLHTTFAAVVTSLDADLGRLFEELRTRGLDQTAAWLVTSDLGYPLGEHGQVGLHRPWLHEELVHVPLLLRLPGAAEAGRRVSAFTQPADLAPTLLGLFGVDALVACSPGHDLLPLVRGEVESVRPHAHTVLECNGMKEASIRTNEWTYLLPLGAAADDPQRRPLLFARPDDRWEINDVLSLHEEVAQELEKQLRQAMNVRP